MPSRARSSRLRIERTLALRRALMPISDHGPQWMVCAGPTIDRRYQARRSRKRVRRRVVRLARVAHRGRGRGEADEEVQVAIKRGPMQVRSRPTALGPKTRSELRRRRGSRGCRRQGCLPVHDAADRRQGGIDVGPARRRPGRGRPRPQRGASRARRAAATRAAGLLGRLGGWVAPEQDEVASPAQRHPLRDPGAEAAESAGDEIGGIGRERDTPRGPGRGSAGFGASSNVSTTLPTCRPSRAAGTR